MMDWLLHLLDALKATFTDILPIAVIIIGFQLLIIRKPLVNPGKTLSGFFYVILGITFFLQGLEMALFPLGELMAKQLTSPAFINIKEGSTTNWQAYAWVYIFAACIGFATTLAEPSLLAVAKKAEEISAGTINAWALRLAVSFGVAFGIALGAFRIVTGSELYFYHPVKHARPQGSKRDKVPAHL